MWKPSKQTYARGMLFAGLSTVPAALAVASLVREAPPGPARTPQQAEAAGMVGIVLKWLSYGSIHHVSDYSTGPTVS